MTDPKLLATPASRRHAPEPLRTAVIGAGISGLTAARTLRRRGFEVVVFEKSPALGGRAATRRVSDGLRFDHGAQYLTARHPSFEAFLLDAMREGVVAEWQGRIVEIDGTTVRLKTNQPRRFVATPDMPALAQYLAGDLLVQFDARIVQLTPNGSAWTLRGADGSNHGPFQSVVITLPAPQAAELLGDHPLVAKACAVTMTPCWAVMAAFARPVPVEWDGAFIHDSPLAWAAHNSSKPGRARAPDTWVLHATADWSAEHLEESEKKVAELLLEEWVRCLSVSLPPLSFLDAKRWRFAAGSVSASPPILCDNATRLVVCGDWLAGGRIEGAYLSGLAAADAISACM